MLTKKQLNIFTVFKKDLFTELTFSQIKAQSKQKSNNVTQLAIKEFKKQGFWIRVLARNISKLYAIFTKVENTILFHN